MAIGDDDNNQCRKDQRRNWNPTEPGQMDSSGGGGAGSLFENDWTPLMEAALQGHLAVVHKLLCTDGVDVNHTSSQFGSALHIAAYHDHPGIVTCLLQGGADMNQRGPASETPVFMAAANGNIGVTEILLHANADISICNNEGLSPLHAAIIQNQSQVAYLLIQHGSNVNKQDSKGNLPLHYAVCYKNTELTKNLLEAGSKKDSMNSSSESATLIAVYNGDLPALELLMSSGCDVNIQKPDGSGLLHVAVSRSSLSGVDSSKTCDILEVLIAAGCQLNTCAFNTLETPLYRALSLQKYNLAQVLIIHGASPNLSSPFDVTALHLACKHQNSITVNLLLHSGIDWKRERWIDKVSYFQTYEDAELFRLLLIWRREPLTLLNLSRITIRKQFKDRLVSRINQLKIPKSVKNFLLFSDISGNGAHMSSRQYFSESVVRPQSWEASDVEVVEGPVASRKSDREDITD